MRTLETIREGRRNEGLEENANVDYKASSEKSKFGGYRAKLINPEGKVSYLGDTVYKTAKAAEGEAAAYRDGYFDGHGRTSDRQANRSVHTYKQKNKKDLYKKESVNEGKKELSILVKLEKMNKALMKEVDNLSKGDDAADLHDQIIEMDKATMKMRDVIRKAMKVNPK